MRLLIFVIALQLCAGHITAQDTEWLKVTDQQTVISVEMPGMPKLERENVLVSGQSVTKDIFSYNANNLEMYFEATPLPGSGFSARVTGKQIKKAIDDLSLRYGGSIQKKQALYRDGIDYMYYEMGIPSGEIIRNVLFSKRNKLFHMYIIGTTSRVFSVDANYYLLNWSVGSLEKVEKVKVEDVIDGYIEIETVKSEPEFIPPENWSTITVGNNISASFPSIPFKKTSVVDLGTKDVTVEAWSRRSETENLNYVLTKREYGREEGLLEDDELYQYIIKRMVSSKKLNRMEEATFTTSGYEGSEYVLAKGIRFYKIRVFRSGQTVFQVLAKGKRKNIHSPEADYFFNQVKLIE